MRSASAQGMMKNMKQKADIIASEQGDRDDERQKAQDDAVRKHYQEQLDDAYTGLYGEDAYESNDGAVSWLLGHCGQ